MKLKLDNQILRNIKDSALGAFKECQYRDISVDLVATLCFCKAIEREAAKQGLSFELDLPPRRIVEPDDA
jgi:hypothetical protein